MTYGITNTGFNAKTFENLKDEIFEKILTAYPQADLVSPSVFGTLAEIFANASTDLWEMAEAVYTSQFPDGASGLSLDRCGSVVLTTRLAAAFTRSFVDVKGSAGTLIPEGTLFSRVDDPETIFSTNADYTIVDSDTWEQIAVTATETGAKLATLISVIDTPISGLDEVRSSTSGTTTTGRDLETDAEYRLRIKSESTIARYGTTDAIKSAVEDLNLDTAANPITEVFVIENDLGVVDPAGRPIGSFEVYTYEPAGTTRDQEIADTILVAKGAGIRPVTTQTGGNAVTLTSTDSQGFNHTISFSRIELVDIYVSMDLITNSNFPSDGVDQVKTAVFNWGQSLGAGSDVVYEGSNSLKNAIFDVAGITGFNSLTVGTAPAPAGTGNITIDDGTALKVEMSAWDTDNINVTV